MKYLRVVSDLHLEFGIFELPQLETDSETILILAGDISVGARASSFLHELVDYNFKHIIYVLGNHEYYNNDILLVKDKIKSVTSDIPNLSVIDSFELITIDNQDFVCGTLWTDCNRNDYFTKQKLVKSVNDYYAIRKGEKILTPDDTYELFQQTIFKMADVISDKTIVVTHHLPSDVSVPQQFKSDVEGNGAFRSNLDSFILDRNPKMWIHGHTHSNVDCTIGDTRILCNPRGYAPHDLNRDFNPSLLINLFTESE